MSALSLRPLLERGSPLIVPGAADVLSAKLIDDTRKKEDGA